MTLAYQYCSAIGATIRRDTAIFMSYRFRFVSQLLTLLLSLTAFFYVSKLVRPDAVGPHGRYYAFVVIGIVMMTILTSALTTAHIVQQELMQGNFERILVSPLGPVGGVLSVAAFPILYSIAMACLTLGVSTAIFPLPLHLAGLAPGLAVTFLAALAFASLGLIFVAMLVSAKSATGATWVIAVLGLVGGTYFPVRLFPGWLRWISDVQPLTPALDLTRHLLISTPLIQPFWLEMLRLGAFTLVLLPASAALLWLSVNLSRRRGTLIEF